MIPGMPNATLSVRVQPGARSDVFVGLRDGAIIVRVSAPPREGRANEAVRRLLAGALGVRASRVTILRGGRARDKLVVIDGIDQAAADAAIRVAIGESSGG